MNYKAMYPDLEGEGAYVGYSGDELCYWGTRFESLEEAMIETNHNFRTMMDCNGTAEAYVLNLEERCIVASWQGDHCADEEVFRGALGWLGGEFIQRLEELQELAVAKDPRLADRASELQETSPCRLFNSAVWDLYQEGCEKFDNTDGLPRVAPRAEDRLRRSILPVCAGRSCSPQDRNAVHAWLRRSDI